MANFLTLFTGELKMKKLISCLAVFVLLVMNGPVFALGSGESIFNSLSLKKRTDDPATGTGEGKIYYKGAGAPTYDSETVLMLHMDGSGNSFTDSSSSGHTVNYNGDATQTSTPASPLSDGGNVASFDGTGDYLTIPDSEDWDFGTGNFTIDMWVKLDSVSGQRGVFHYDGEDFFLRITSSALLLQVGNTGVSKSWNASLDEWYHLAGVRSSTDTVRLYVNGEQLGNDSTAADNITGATSLFIGSSASPGDYFDGNIDELRLSNTARWTSDFTPPTKNYGSGGNSEGLYFKDENGTVVPITEVLP